VYAGALTPFDGAHTAQLGAAAEGPNQDGRGAPRRVSTNATNGRW
jgi:hypothetical protein